MNNGNNNEILASKTVFGWVAESHQTVHQITEKGGYF